MAVTALEIKTRSPFAQGTAFGDSGPYEQLDGTVHFAVDPDHPRNAGITDLQTRPTRCARPGAVLGRFPPAQARQRSKTATNACSWISSIAATPPC